MHIIFYLEKNLSILLLWILLRGGGALCMVIQSSYFYWIYPLYYSLSISLRYSVTKRKEESETAYFYSQRTWNDMIKFCFRALNSSTGFPGRSLHPLSPPWSSLYLGIRRPTGRKDHGKVQRLQGKSEKVIFDMWVL